MERGSLGARYSVNTEFMFQDHLYLPQADAWAESDTQDRGNDSDEVTQWQWWCWNSRNRFISNMVQFIFPSPWAPASRQVDNLAGDRDLSRGVSLSARLYFPRLFCSGGVFKIAHSLQTPPARISL